MSRQDQDFDHKDMRRKSDPEKIGEKAWIPIDKSAGEYVQEPSGAEAYIKKTGENTDRIERESRQQKKAFDSRIPEGGGHTKEEYFSLPDDLRVELIDGVFYAMASPSLCHQAAALEIAKQLDSCIEEQDVPSLAVIAPSDVILGEDGDTVVQPDVYILCEEEPAQGFSADRRGKVPDFMVEVLSPSNPENDLWRKRALYQRYGVREYWIVNPAGQKVFVFLFEKDEKDRTGKTEGDFPEEYSFDDDVPVMISNGVCKIDFRRVREKVRRAESI